MATAGKSPLAIRFALWDYISTARGGKSDMVTLSLFSEYAWDIKYSP